MKVKRLRLKGRFQNICLLEVKHFARMILGVLPDRSVLIVLCTEHSLLSSKNKLIPSHFKVRGKKGWQDTVLMNMKIYGFLK